VLDKLLVKAVATGALVFVPTIAHAQQPATVTLSSEIKPVFYSGELRGCALNFEVGRQDAEYSGGKVVYITGSLNFYLFENREPQFALKLGVKLSADANFVPPAEAYLIADHVTNREDFVSSVAGETPGFLIFSFGTGQTSLAAALTEVGETGTLTFGYAMRPGGMGAIVPVDLRSRDVDLDQPNRSVIDETAPAAWLDCLRDATQSQIERTQ
jgi:hypothetical protein